MSELEQRFIAISTALAVALVGGASTIGTAASNSVFYSFIKKKVVF